MDDKVVKALETIEQLEKDIVAFEAQVVARILKIRMANQHGKRWMLEARTDIQKGFMCLKRAVGCPQDD